MIETTENGLLILLDKPLGWTSFDAVSKLRNLLKIRKIGHAGTLDPLATGLLIICAGKMTKRIEEFQGLEKEYEGTFVIGQTTASYDLEKEPTEAVDISHITPEMIHKAATSFLGKIEQIPPAHSSVKVDGKRAYALARKGKEVALKPRSIEIHEFVVTSIRLPEVGFRVRCSKGTYIRSLAHDFGAALGVGAYLSQLRRTRIGNFTVQQADTIDSIKEKAANLRPHVTDAAS